MALCFVSQQGLVTKLRKTRVKVKNTILAKETLRGKFLLKVILQGIVGIRIGLPSQSKCETASTADGNKKKKPKPKMEKMTCNLVIKLKIDIQREQQQPNKLQSNFSSMLQAPGLS